MRRINPQREDSWVQAETVKETEVTGVKKAGGVVRVCDGV